LDFSNGSFAHGCISDGKSSNSLLTEWRVKDPMLTKLFSQTNRTTKDATKCDILSIRNQDGKIMWGKKKESDLTKDDCSVISFQRNTHRIIHGGEIIHSFSRTIGSGLKSSCNVLAPQRLSEGRSH
jgi:hypothetical protein